MKTCMQVICSPVWVGNFEYSDVGCDITTHQPMTGLFWQLFEMFDVEACAELADISEPVNREVAW